MSKQSLEEKFTGYSAKIWLEELIYDVMPEGNNLVSGLLAGIEQATGKQLGSELQKILGPSFEASDRAVTKKRSMRFVQGVG